LVTRVSAVLGTLVLLLGVWVAIDVITARNSLEVARASLLDARAALGAQDLGRARTRIDVGVQAAARADARMTGVRWDAIRQLPVVGEDARTTKDVIRVVAAAARTAQASMDVLDGVLTEDDGLPQLTDDDRLDLAPIRALARGFAALDLQPLRDAQARLATSADRPWTSTVRDARAETLEAAEEALAWIERGQDATAVASAFLGVDRPSRLLVMVQNNGELRGTGGLIGFLAVLEVGDGLLTLSAPEGVDTDALVTDGDLIVRGRFGESSFVDDPVARPPDFAARYDAIAGGAMLVSANADPDLPTVAPIVLELYQQRTGEQLDGVLAIDPIALQRLQQTVGPLELPEGVHRLAPELPHPLPAEQVAATLLIDVYDALGGATEERRTYQAAVAEASLAALLGGDWDVATVAGAIGSSVAGRNLQVYARDPEVQAAITRLGVDGALAARDGGDDLVAISANNAAGNKLDVHVAHRTEVAVDLAEPRLVDGDVLLPRTVTTRIEVRNPVDVDQHDDYIVQSLQPTPIGAQIERDPDVGLARTWLTQWLPAATEVVAVTDGAGGSVPFSIDAMHDRRAVDHFLEVPAGGRGAFQVTSSGWAVAEWDGAELTYAVTFWRQGKAIPDELDVSVTPPPGWQLVDATFTGGAGAGSLGPGAPGSPLDTNIEDGVARLRGSATADTRLVLRLVREGR
jgi:hypothetical protein